MKRFSTEFSKRHLPIFVLALILLLGMAVASRAQTYTSFDYPGGFNTTAFGINEWGDIVGRYTDADGNTHGFLLKEGQFTTIDFPHAKFTVAIDINNWGDIVGRYEVVRGVSHGFILQDETFTTIDFPRAVDTRVRGIDDLRRITGNYRLKRGNETGFFLDAGGFHTVIYPESVTTDVWDINDLGQMVGDYSDANDIVHAYKLVQGVITPIPDFPLATTGTSARHINCNGDIVGNWAGDDQLNHGFLLTRNGKFQDIEFPGMIETQPTRMNNQGTIVGSITDTDGNGHGFVRTPK